MDDTRNPAPAQPASYNDDAGLWERDLIAFDGERGPLAWLILRNAALSIITFGIYRFWARTRIRNFYWTHTTLLRDRFEYTGTGGELFVGFLIVMVILIPLSIGYASLETIFLTLFPDLQALSEVAYLVGLYWLFQFAFFRARRYRLSRTAWRGIHAGQTGSAAQYALRATGWAFACAFSLGIAVPWAHVSLQRYEITNARLGDTNFGYAGHVRDVWKWWWPVMACFVLPFAFWAFQIFDNYADAPVSVDPAVDPELAELRDGEQFEFWIRLLWPGFLFFVAAMFLYIRFRLAMVRYLFNVMSLGRTQFRSSMRLMRVVLAAVVAALVPFLPWVILGIFLFGMLAGLKTGDPIPGGGAFFLIFLAALLSFFLLPLLAIHLFFYVPFVRHVTATLEISRPDELEDLVQGMRDDPRFGEGLADAFSVDVGAI